MDANKEKNIEMTETDSANKYAAAQLEEKIDDLREKPSLKVKHSEGADYLEAVDEDLDVLTDAVHAAMVTYYKRKNGYCQCCKYVLFMCIFILVCFQESHVDDLAYTHGVAHNFKETLFPDMAEDNIGFPGGRVPNRYTGWANVYEFFADSVAPHFSDPRVGDTLCTGPVEYAMWGGFGSTDCGLSTANVSQVTVTVTLTPELVAPTQQNIVCPPETRNFRLLEPSEFNYDTKRFTVYVDKQVGDTTVAGDANTWAPIVGSTVTIGDTIDLRVVNEKIPALVKGGIYHIAEVKPRLDKTPTKCKTVATVATVAARRRLNTVLETEENSRKLFTEPGMDYGPPPCMNDNDGCMFDQDCCSQKCDKTLMMCKSADTLSAGGVGSSGGTSAEDQTVVTGDDGEIIICYYVYDISLVPKSIYDANLVNSVWRQKQNVLEVGCNETYWNTTALCDSLTSSSSPTLASVCSGGLYDGALKNSAATTDCGGPVCSSADSATCCNTGSAASCQTITPSSTPNLAIVCSSGALKANAVSLSCAGLTCGTSDASNCCETTSGGGGGNANCGTISDSSNPTLAMVCDINNVNNGFTGLLNQNPGSISCGSSTCQISDASNCCEVGGGSGGAGVPPVTSGSGRLLTESISTNEIDLLHRRLCSNDGNTCVTSAECCSGECSAGLCQFPGSSTGGETSKCSAMDPEYGNPSAQPNGSPCTADGFCCSSYCDHQYGICDNRPLDGGCQRLPNNAYCYDNEECCSEICTNNACSVATLPSAVVKDDYVKACNGTLVGIFSNKMGTISGVKGLSKDGKCSIDKERPLLAQAKYNLCSRNPYTKGADLTRCIFNDGRGVTKDVSIGGRVQKSSTVTQTARVNAVDGEWMLVVNGIKNAKINFNVTWQHPEGLKATKSQITNICSQTNRSLIYKLGTGDAFEEACKALQAAFPNRATTVCADMSCDDTTTPHQIFNYYEPGTHFHYFPDQDGTRERYFRGTGNKMIAGVLISQHRFSERPCRPRDTARYNSLFDLKSNAKCIDEEKLNEDNLMPFGADPIYLPSSTMFVEAEVATKGKVFKEGSSTANWGKVIQKKTSDTEEDIYSDYNPSGSPYGFKVSTNKKLAKQFGHAIMFQNNLKQTDANKLVDFLQEGFYLDALTKDIKVTYVTFNAYDMSYHKFNAIFRLSFPTGGIEVKYDHMSFTVDPYFNNVILWPLQFLYWFLVFLTAAEELKEVFIACASGENYFADGWNYCEIICVALQLFNFAYWWVIQWLRDDFLPQEQYVVYPMQTYKVGGMLHGRNETEFNKALKMYSDIEDITAKLGTYEAVQTIVLFFILLRWFKQLDFHPEFGVITRTCAQSWKSLSQWLVVFLVVQFVFILGGFYSFGQTVAEFSTLGNTIFVQYQLLNGDLTILASLWQTNNLSVNPVTAYVYVFTYYTIVFIIMLNVLLGIVIDAYTDQRDRASEDPLTPDESPWEEMSMLMYHEGKASLRAFVECCQSKRKVNVNPMVEIQQDVKSLNDEEAKDLNNRARLTAQLREILAGSLAVGGGSKMVDPTGRKIKLKTPKWGSDYYQLRYSKPVDMVVQSAQLLRTSRGDLTHAELTELLHYQFKKYSVDTDKGKTLSKKVAELAIWRYGKNLNVETRREIGVEHRNEMNEHRFNRLEEQIAYIAESGTAQWGEVQKAIVTVAATQYIPNPINGANSVVVEGTTVVSSQSVDTVDL